MKTNQQEVAVVPCSCEHCAKDGALVANRENDDGGSALTSLIARVRVITGTALFVIGLFTVYEFFENPVSAFAKTLPFAEFILFFAAYLLIGCDVLLDSIKNILRGKIFDENFLMSVSSIGAFCIGEYPEAVAVMLFYKIGEAFEEAATGKSRASISSLMDIRPDYANIMRGDAIERVSPSEVNVGDIIIVKAGEKIPLDGIVVEGASSIDTSALTGEAAPRDVEAGSEILSGSINKTGTLTIRVMKTERESTVAKILDLVEHSSEKKSRMENFITRFARYYTPCVCAAALLLAVLPPLVSGNYDFAVWLKRALVFLVVSCPCALVISVPLSFFGGIGSASKAGILIKGGNYLEALCKADTVIFDKTGTLTKGIFRVSGIVNSGAFTNDDIVRYAAYAESFSNHPLALSVRNAYGKAIDQSIVHNAEELAGRGVKVTVEGKAVLAGNTKLLESANIPFEKYHGPGSVIYIAVDGEYAGYIVINDEIKKGAAEAITELKELGINKIILLTGDTKASAVSIAETLGITQVHSELLPNEKCEYIELIKNDNKASSVNGKRGGIIFAGDGINDAPSLAISDVGIAMGGIGSDAAIEAADIVLMNDDLKKIPEAIKISRKTHRIAMQNIVFALGIKGIILLAGALGGVSIWVAVFGDVGVALLAILNSMRALSRGKTTLQ
jgi:Cd2+/Zn2+-exporting ATPase